MYVWRLANEKSRSEKMAYGHAQFGKEHWNNRPLWFELLHRTRRWL
jgi:hypothetical protein